MNRTPSNRSGPLPRRWWGAAVGITLICLLALASIRMPKGGRMTVELLEIRTNKTGARCLAYTVRNPLAHVLSLNARLRSDPGSLGSWETIPAHSTNQCLFVLGTNRPPHQIDILYFEEAPSWVARSIIFLESLRGKTVSGVSLGSQRVELPPFVE